MKCLLRMMLLALGCLLVWGADRACAQLGGFRPGGIGQATTPTYSPYLNLLNNTNLPLYQRYYGQTRPELELRGDVYGLQQQITANDYSIGSLRAGGGQGVLVTGHQTAFLSTGGYFPNGRGRQGGGGGVGGAGGVRLPQSQGSTGQTPSLGGAPSSQLPSLGGGSGLSLPRY